MHAHAQILRLLHWMLAPLLLAALAPAARADGCGNCPSPSKSRIAGEVGGARQLRDGVFGKVADVVYTDKGDCIVSMEGAPVVTPLFYWLEERASGEVWNCPHSKSHDTITVEAGKSDSTEWTVTAKAGFKLDTAIAEVKAQIEGGNSSGVTITEVTRVAKTIIPGWCRRMPWTGYLLLGKFRAEADFTIEQEWAWWTKNPTTGDKVHASGRFTVHCGSATLEMQRQAPLAGHFELTENVCDDPACGTVIPRHLGFFPPLPKVLKPDEESEPEPDAPGAEGPSEAGEPDEESGEPGEESGEPESSSDLDDPPAGSPPNPLEGDGP